MVYLFFNGNTSYSTTAESEDKNGEKGWLKEKSFEKVLHVLSIAFFHAKEEIYEGGK